MLSFGTLCPKKRISTNSHKYLICLF